MQGTATDISIQAEEILQMKKRINQILASHTGKPVSSVEKDTDRDYYLSSEDAKTYGLIDHILTQRPKTETKKG